MIFSCRSGYPSEPSDTRRSPQYATPSRRVQATALRPPLQVSNTNIEFVLPSGYYDMGIENAAGRAAVSISNTFNSIKRFG